MAKSKFQHPYYNYDKLFSRNAVINIVSGGRGIGKTYGAKKFVIGKAISKGEQFIFMRRYREELQASAKTFTADIGHEWPDYDFRIEQRELQFAPIATRDVKPREWRTAGFFIPLSIAQNYKSTAYPNVTTIVFDEFIKETSSTSPYLRNEADALVNFYFTVDRGQDRTRLLMLSNAVTIDNPYFVKWGIQPDQEGEWVIKDNGFIAAHFPDSDLFQKSIYKTRFGKWIAGTEYAEYAVGNVFKDNHDEMIQAKPASAKPMFNMEVEAGTFGVWLDAIPGEWYVTRKTPSLEKTVVLDAHRMGEDKVMWARNDDRLGILKRAFRRGRMSFEDPLVRAAFMEINER